jgi:hypothetical protein
MTDLCDKYSNSSSTFLSLNVRLGAGVSEDSCDGLLQVDTVNLNKSKDLSHQKVFF